jgi:hypothetical protein
MSSINVELMDGGSSDKAATLSLAPCGRAVGGEGSARWRLVCAAPCGAPPRPAAFSRRLSPQGEQAGRRAVTATACLTAVSGLPAHIRRQAGGRRDPARSMTGEGRRGAIGAGAAGSAVFPHGSLFFPKSCGCQWRARSPSKDGRLSTPYARAACGGRRPLTAAKLRKFMLP